MKTIHPNWKREGPRYPAEKHWEYYGIVKCEACNRRGQCKNCRRPFSISTALDNPKDFCSIRCEGELQVA
jgi:hypothetical protein